MIDVESFRRRTVDRTSDAHLLLGGIVLVGLVLRAYALGAESLWVDEIHTTRAVLDHSLGYIVLVLPITDPHPPFYYAVLWVWTQFTGVSATSVRALSVLASVLSIPVLYAVATRLYDRRVGLFSALVFAFSPFYVWYAREARMYALMTLLGLWSFYAMLTWLDGASEWWRSRWGYVLATVALIYTHAFGVLLVVAQNVYVVWFLDPDAADEDWYRRWGRTQGIVFLLGIPWFYDLLGGMFGEGRFEANVAWIPDVTPLTLWKILGSYVGRTIPPASPFARRSLWTFGSTDLSVVGEVVTLVALALLVWLLVRYVRTGPDAGDDAPADATTDDGHDETAAPESAGESAVPESAGGSTVSDSAGGTGSELTADAGPDTRVSSGVLLACWLLVPVGILYGASVLVTPLLFDRFTAAMGVAGVILLARAVTLLPKTDRQTMAAAGLVVLVLGVPLTGIYTQPQKEQWEEAVNVVESNADSGDVVIVTPFWTNDSYQYYADRSDLEYAALPAGPPSWRVAQVTRQTETVWVVVSHYNASQRERLHRSLNAVGYDRERHAKLTDVTVFHYEQR